MLEEVEWGEFKLETLFNSLNGNFDIKKKHINGRGDYVVTAGLTNNGILGKSDVEARVFSKNTITVDMFGGVFYRNHQYKLVTHARVFALIPKFKMNEKIGLFISNSMHYFSKQFGYNNMCSWAKIKEQKIQLPIKNDRIDFKFMEQFIEELKLVKIKELDAYLVTSGLDDYILTEEEKLSLDNFDQLEWKDFKMDQLFERMKTKKISMKAKELPRKPVHEYALPALTSSFNNQGLNYFVPRSKSTVLNNVISIPSNSDVYRAYYQPNDFTILSDAYAIKWSFEDIDLLSTQYLFAVTSINKVTDLPIYSYKNKLGGWNTVKNKHIKLPVKNSKPDYSVMKNLISALQKNIIKEVVLYRNEKFKGNNPN